MPKADVHDVKTMLRMADREWSNNGLAPHDKGGQDPGTYEAMLFLDSYRGDFPESFSGAVENVDQMVGNMVFSIINTLVSQISARDPEPVLRPHGGTAAEPTAWRRAWLNQKIITTLMREKKFKREVDRALLSALLLPFGMVRHGYTPDVEEYENDRGEIMVRFRNQTPDLPWIQFVRPWQVRIDPLVNNFDMDGEPSWIAFHHVYTRRQIRNNPSLVMRDDWKPTFHEDLRPMHERRKPKPTAPSAMPRAGSSKNENHMTSLYEEWVVYDATTRTFFGVSPGSDKLVREEREWPVDWQQLPASILTFNEQLDSPFGVPFPRMIWHEQAMYNKIWTTINALINRVRRVVLVNGSAFQSDPGQLENLLNPESLAEFVVADGNVREIANELGFGTIDGQLVGLLFQLKEQIREILGVSSFDRGQRANVETAAEANQIGAGGQNAKGRTQHKFETFWTDIFRASHRALIQTEDARSFFVPIVGEDNVMFLTQSEIAQGFIEVSPADLAGEFDYGMKQNSTLPLDPTAEFVRLAEAYNVVGGPQAPLVNHVHVQKRLFTLVGEDAEKVVVDQQVAEQMGQDPEVAAAQGETGGAPPGAEGVPLLQGLPGGGT